MARKPTYEELEQRVKELEKEATECKWAEEALKESELRFRELADLLPVSVFELDVDGNFTYSNRCGFETFGYSHKDLANGVNALQLFIPEERQRVKQNIRKRLTGEKFEDHEYTALKKDGSTLTVLISTAAIIRDNKSVGVRGIVLDITERKQVEEAVRQSEKEYRTLIEVTSEGYWLIDPERKTLDVNQSLCDMLGYSREEIIGKRPLDFVDDENRKIFKSQMAQIEDTTHRTYDIVLKNKSGKDVYTHFSATTILDESGTVQGAFALITDITRRKQAEHRVKHLNAVLRSIRNVNELITKQKDPDKLLQGACNNLVETRGYYNAWIAVLDESGGLLKTAEADVGEAFLSMVELLNRGELTDCAQRALAQTDVVVIQNPLSTCADCPLVRSYAGRGAMTVRLEYEGRLYGLLSVSISRDFAVDEEEQSLFQEVAGDIAFALHGIELEEERKRAEEALKESEARYRALFEASADGILIADSEARKFKYANPALCKMIGYSEEELRGMSVNDIHPKDDLKYVVSAFEAHTKGDKTYTPEIPCLRKDGTIIYADINTAITLIDGRKCTLGLFRDITRRKQAEQALEQAYDELEQQVEARTKELAKANEKLKEEIYERKRAGEVLLTYHEKLRSLASKLSLAEEGQRRHVAIEVHDRISQNLAFLKMKLGALRPLSSSSSLAGAMDEILELVGETIQNTRALISELGSPILYELGFVPAVEWLTQQAQRQHGIVVDFQDDGQPKPLSEDVGVLLFQAARELLVNIAKHAKARTAKVSITRDGNQVRVDVEDDGIGFDSAEIGPSVDTTGRFGLFSIRMRLEPLGGHMEVDSKPGHGTRVTLVAPLKHNGENKKEKVS